jgi:signal transduction histidine kinase
VREAVSQLRDSGAIDLGAALLPLAEKVPALAIHMDIEEPLTLDDPQRAHVLLRCTQEIITNAVRHAGARNLWVHCRREAGSILIDARDDGAGADAVISGNGLRGMAERLAQYGGALDIETQPGKGFCLHIRLPAAESTGVLPLRAEPETEPLSETAPGGSL